MHERYKQSRRVDAWSVFTAVVTLQALSSAHMDVFDKVTHWMYSSSSVLPCTCCKTTCVVDGRGVCLATSCRCPHVNYATATIFMKPGRAPDVTLHTHNHPRKIYLRCQIQSAASTVWGTLRHGLIHTWLPVRLLTSVAVSGQGLLTGISLPKPRHYTFKAVQCMPDTVRWTRPVRHRPVRQQHVVLIASTHLTPIPHRQNVTTSDASGAIAVT